MSCRPGSTCFDGCECRSGLLRDALAVCRKLRSTRNVVLNDGQIKALVTEAVALARDVLAKRGARAGASLKGAGDV